MKRSTVKRLILAGIILEVLAVAGFTGYWIIIEESYVRVTHYIGETDILQGESGLIELPAVDENGAVSKDEGRTAKLTPEQLKMLENKISRQDKEAVMWILVNSLPPEQYSKMLDFATGGISQEEYEQTYDILRQHLSQEKKDEIKSYYAKYVHLLDE